VKIDTVSFVLIKSIGVFFMYELTLDNAANVSGGNNDALGALIVFGGIVTLATIASISAYRPRRQHCTMVDTPFTEVVPVYDPYSGVYLGDQINSYVKTEQVCY
jgi:hypothetical protein